MKSRLILLCLLPVFLLAEDEYEQTPIRYSDTKPNDAAYALEKLMDSGRVKLDRPAAYFEALPRVWRDRTMEMAQDITMSLYPAYLVDEETLGQTDAFLAAPDLAAPLRRLLGEGRDGVVRAMRARAKDA